MIAVLESIGVGLKRRSGAGLTGILAFVGAIWLITDVSTFVSGGIKTFLETHQTLYVGLLLAGSLATGLARIYEPRSVRIQIPTTDTQITLKFADLFKEDGDIVVAVNEFVDSELGQRVSPNSVHGQLIRTWFNSEEEFRQAADAKLAAISGQATARSAPPDIAYPPGTTIRLSAGSRSAYAFVLAHTNLQTDKAFVSLSEAIAAIRALLSFVHHWSGGRTVAMPLIGNGLSGLNLPPQHVLRLLVLLIVSAAREHGLPKEIRICLSEDCFTHLDLREIARDWRR